MSFREARKKNKLTQKQVAQKLGTSRVTVARWECGVNNPKLDTIRKLARLYNCTADELINP
ncbi:MAG: helix-turn-helix transcriptional regulator [Synergistaceae bacterium]|nr:helix-turn-helix transcriptional regulator [Synergistaceae bacterium]